MNIMITSIMVLAVVYISYCAGVFLLQKNAVYAPSSELAATPGDFGLEYQDAVFTAADGAEIHGWFIPGNTGRAVLFCHGNAGNISHRMDTIRLVHQMGLSLLIFDYRGYGESKGQLTEKGTVLDALAGFEFLRSRGFAAGDIVIWGRSLGGAVAVQAAAKAGPGQLILESSFTSVPDMAARLYRLLPARLLCRYDYPSLETMRLVSIPVLVIHSPEDEVIPYDMGQKLYQAATGPKKFLQISGDHNQGFLQSMDVYKTGLEEFLDIKPVQ